MARLEQGILGPFSGKVGEVVGSTWKGMPYIKARPTSFHDAKTPGQLTHRMKLKLAHSFVRSIKPMIEIGFRQVTGTQTPYNNAVSYIIKNALVGECPDVDIAPSEVVVSKGKLAGANDCSFAVAEEGNIVFSWDEAVKGNGASDEDQTLLLVYNFTKMQGLSFQACRKDKSGGVKIPADWNDDSLACYIFFASASNEDVSNSEFLGIIEP